MDAFINALTEMVDMEPAERQEMGRLGRLHTEKNYSLEKNMQAWDDLLTKVHEECGSWDTRKNYEAWEFIEL